MAARDQLTALGTDAIRRGVSWWLAELRALLPWRLAGHPDRAPAILDVSATQATLVLAKRGAAEAEEVPLRGLDPDEARLSVRSAMQRRRIGDVVVIRLDQSLLLRSSVSLPLAAERSLRAILQHQLERLVPLPAAEICFEYRVVSRSPTARTLNVELVIATLASIDDAVALARSVGLAPRLAIAETAPGEAPAALWRPDREAEDSLSLRRLKRGMELAAIVFLLVAYGVYVYRLDAARDEVQADIAEAMKKALVARDLVRRHAETEHDLALLAQRQKELSPLFLLNELSGLVPDTAWVSQLSLQNRVIEIIGYSPRVSDLVSRIDASDVFWNLKFRSPMTLTPDGKGERFDVSFDVWTKDQPS